MCEASVGRGRTLGAAALVLAGALACGGAPDEKAAASPAVPGESTTMVAEKATGGARVLFVGTSLTAGLGLDPDSAYPAVIQRLADSAGFRVTVAAAGLSGETSAGALRRVDWLLQDRADVVVIETGANDGLRGLDPDSTQANIVGIIGKVRAADPDTRVLLVQMEAPPNLGPRYTREFRDLFLNVARDHAVTLIPFFLNGVAGEAALNQADGIHPNEEGARRAARNMWRALAPVLAETPGVVVR
jgi:acyl-CoA thioesterase I